ncbi:TonB-system energizer ExbB [Helicobacter cappadocius]|uniref:TonB-system energizer ExbB n=1 Tax=Helicobacter cappadocius TaxID=3063998 RepID=A0AA90ST45_9HELI|nr:MULTISPECIES: TonB-system energizer ExbB [unclassified Helicobacter]MDO7253698.1 TonB-system energizer ExbB [Helicobacter sp. faydin-H75]MDP2539614.1 TonB-system energizer ExbB [Helicobacter sp. faydin-H76]
MEFLKLHIDHIVFVVLGIMGFLTIWFTVERVMFYWKIKVDTYEDIDMLEEHLTKNLTTLYIIYSNAPYVGLLGTVVGIMITFYDMGMSGGMDAKTIMVGLSLALKATALGLVVAIPTLVIYNALVRKVDTIVNRFKVAKK